MDRRGQVHGHARFCGSPHRRHVTSSTVCVLQPVMVRGLARRIFQTLPDRGRRFGRNLLGGHNLQERRKSRLDAFWVGGSPICSRNAATLVSGSHADESIHTLVEFCILVQRHDSLLSNARLRRKRCKRVELRLSKSIVPLVWSGSRSLTSAIGTHRLERADGLCKRLRSSLDHFVRPRWSMSTADRSPAASRGRSWCDVSRRRAGAKGQRPSTQSTAT